MLKKLALAVMLVCGVAVAQQTTTLTPPSSQPVLEPGVVYNTGNIVQPTTTTTGSTWVGAVYQNQLTCWTAGDPGYCGPQAIVRPGNNINFSYGSTYVYQQQHISTLLPTSVSGIQVNGYNFSFTAKNGNGWDDGRTDQLTALVRFWDNTGSKGANNLLYGNSWNLSYKYNWTTFNYSDTFTTPLSVPSIGQVQYGFIGRDNNGWAGPYGPELTGISFSLKYSVDPCATNPMYSPTCPGYLDALNKLLPAPISVEPVAATTTAATTITEPAAAPVATTSTAPSLQPSVVAAVVSAPAPSTASSSTTSSTSAAASTRENSGANTSQAMSIISRNQERDRETLAIAQTAVSAAVAAAAAAQQEAAAVAATAVANSTNNAATVGGAGNAGTGIRSSAAVSNAATQTSAFQLVSGASAVSANAPQTQNTNAAALASANTMDAAPVVQTQSLATTGTGSNVAETNVALSSNFLTDRSNPLNTVLEQRLQMPPASTMTATGPTVNTRAVDNEAAAGVTIATMALAPAGYGDYLNFTMRDAAFYAPREIYRNQRNVDNQRALRQLTNDSRHREMVEQQYRR
jgi:hypothetical protein